MKSETVTSHESQSLMKYQKMRRLALFVAILLVGTMMLAVRPSWQNAGVPQFIEYAGAGFIWVGLIGRLWSILYIGGHKSSAVVMDGPYSVMRNPLYFFSTIAAVGVGFQTGTLTGGILCGFLCALAFHIVILREEKYLSTLFGGPYAGYRNAVPRFFPNIALFKDEEYINVSTRRMYSTLLDGMVFFVAVPIFELADYLQGAGILPVLFNWY